MVIGEIYACRVLWRSQSEEFPYSQDCREMSGVVLLKERKKAGPAHPAVFDIMSVCVCVCGALQWVRNKALPPNKAALLLAVGNVMLQSTWMNFFCLGKLARKTITFALRN